MTSPDIRVLLVEDDMRLATLTRTYLESRGLEVVHTADGDSALDLLRETDVTAVVLDLMLPGIDGYEVCRRLRAWFVGPFAIYQVYWGLWAVVLGVAAWLLATRGTDATFKRRLAEARGRASAPVIALGGGALAAALGLGGFIFYETNIVHGYQTAKDAEQDAADGELTYRAHWYGVNQPRVTDVDLVVDLSPETGDFAATGQLEVFNRGAEPITEVFLSVNRHATWDELTLSGGAVERAWDDRFGVMILDLDRV
jgi:hypothetical protein